MKKQLCFAFALALLLGGCAQAGKEEPQGPGLYTTVVHYAGENDSEEKYLQIARRSRKLVELLEEKAGAFAMDVYNYQMVDDKGTPLYTMNTLHYPGEVDPNGRTIRVSRNYFLHNPVETADGIDLLEQLIYDGNTLNLLVPEQYRALEAQIVEGHRGRFYFERVTAENDYNEMAGCPERLKLTEEELSVHIIYVKEGQRYFTFRSDCAMDTGNWVQDPVVQIYTGNIHCNYAHSFLTQWLYFPVEGETEPYGVEECGAGESVQKVVRAYEG